MTSSPFFLLPSIWLKEWGTAKNLLWPMLNRRHHEPYVEREAILLCWHFVCWHFVSRSLLSKVSMAIFVLYIVWGWCCIFYYTVMWIRAESGHVYRISGWFHLFSAERQGQGRRKEMKKPIKTDRQDGQTRVHHFYIFLSFFPFPWKKNKKYWHLNWLCL